jgi:hypothetical protein
VSDTPGDDARRKWLALAVLLALAVPLVAVAVITSGGGPPAGGLRIERGSGEEAVGSLTIYVEEPARNVPDAAGGRTNVRLECLDANDKVVRNSTHPWPFTDTDDGSLDPHVHERLPQVQANEVASCRLAGTEGPLEGRVATPRG